ncbi:MAG TPA: hypothetical protein VEG34_13285 [Thermoanaerobaculia bacterium]|nr:hypothetical protein [Thermoanaerobaculia bacterium]
MMRRALPVLLLLLAVPAFAQSPPPAAPPADDPVLAAIKALPALAGRWEGGGTIRQGPGEPVRFVGEETVETRLDGRLMLVEGRHWTPDRSRVVHHAFAVLSYDSEAKAYRFRTHLIGRPGGDFPAFLENGALVWEIPSPAGKTRFTIRVEGDRWHEVGTIERDGKTYPFFEMDLRRVAAPAAAARR